MGENYKNVRKVLIPESTKDLPITFLSGGKAKYTYVYVTDEKRYISDKKHNQNKRVCIGRLDYKLSHDWSSTGTRPAEMLPNSSFSSYFSEELYKIDPVKEDSSMSNENIPKPEEEELRRGDAISIGVFLVIEKLIRDYQLRKMFPKTLDDLSINQLLDFAAFMIIMEDNAALHFENYEYRHQLFQKGNGVKDEQIGRLFSSILVETIDTFLNNWNKENIKRSKEEQTTIYFVGDGTDHHCQAGDIEIASFGNAKVDDGTPIISMMLAYDLLHKLPVYYDLYDGSINDVSECKYLISFLKALGYGNFGVILDRGFYSSDNIAEFNKRSISFILMAKGWKKFIRNQVLKICGTFEHMMSSYIERYDVYATTITHSITNDKHTQCCHIFFKPALVSVEQSGFRNKLKSWKKSLDKLVATKESVDKCSLNQCALYFNLSFSDTNVLLSYTENTTEINNELKLAGYFVIISSEVMTAVESLILYKSRDVNEKMNMFDKTFLGNSTYRVGSDESQQGKGFTAFLALILRNGMYVNLKKEEARVGKIRQIYDVPTAVAELEKIEVTRYPNDRYAHRRSLTRKQKDILHAFGLTDKKAALAIESVVRKLNGIEVSESKSASK